MDRHDAEPEPMETKESNQYRQDNHVAAIDIPENADANANFVATLSDSEQSEERIHLEEERKRKIRINKEQQRENIMTSGHLLIVAVMDRLRTSQAGRKVMRHYMERVLHSIFFFGHINCPPISPDEFLPDKVAENFNKFFPKPFMEYNTHLPYYTPYSILLEYMTIGQKREDLDSLVKELEVVNKSLLKPHHEQENQFIANDFAFNASVVTYCYVKDPNNAEVLKKAFGSSLSCKGKIQRKIMIFISALHVWDRAISNAVCCAGRGPPITFPGVYSIAFDLRKKEYKPPCNKCAALYRVHFTPEHEASNKPEDWPYGNCAENESFSRLLHGDEDLRKEICIIGDNGQKLKNRKDIENNFRDEHEDEIEKQVRHLLKSRKFKLPLDKWNFFTPDQSD